MDIVIWTYIFGGATLFALIVGLFSVYNGRMTRREIERGDQRTHTLLERMNGHLEKMDGRLEKMNGRPESIDGRMEKLAEHMEQLALHMQDMDKRHTELLTRIAEKIR
ncbi:hypothetical protein MYX78_08545 [Acidobacteria bacterium AH-259-G07]|nr:hypothetical protein [Acidobacteria bacterium AH-259-G07]